MNAQTPKPRKGTPPVWRQSDGKPVACSKRSKSSTRTSEEIETPLRRCAGGRSPDGMRCRADQEAFARADRQARRTSRQKRQSMRARAALAVFAAGSLMGVVAGIGTAGAQTSPSTATDSATLRRIGQADRRTAGPRQGDGAHPALRRAGRRGDPLRHARDHGRRLPGEHAGRRVRVGRLSHDRRSQARGRPSRSCSRDGCSPRRLPCRRSTTAVYDVRVLACTRSQGSSPPSSR